MNIKKRIVSILLATSILLGASSCGKQKNQDEKNDISDTIDSEEVLSEADYVIKCRNEIDNIKPNYKLLDYYPSSDMIDIIAKQEESEDVCPFEAEDLSKAIHDTVENIRKNSIKMASRSNIYDGYADFKEDYFQGKYDLEYFITLCLTDVLMHSTNDVSEDLCTLQDFSIVLADNFPWDNAAARCDYRTKTIVIYIEKLKKTVEDSIAREELDDSKKVERFQELLYQKICCVLNHEFNHVRQWKCSHRYRDDSISLNNYAGYIQSSMLIESSAESALYNLNIDPNRSDKRYVDYAYVELRQDESLLLLMGMMNSSLDGYYNGIFDSKFSELYDFFHLETKEELESFYRILYSLDSINERTNLPKEVGNSDTRLSLAYEIGNDYFIDIVKITLKNMMEYSITHPDFTLEENAVMFHILKDKIALRATCFNGERFCYGKDFVLQFDALIQSYEEFLKAHYPEANMDNDFNLGIRNIVESIYFYIQDLPIVESYDEEQLDKVETILKKFPVLQSIIYTEYLEGDFYDMLYSDASKEELYGTVTEEDDMSLVYTNEIS